MIQSRTIGLTDEGLRIKGTLQVQLIRASTGEIVEHYEADNLVVNGGRTGMAHLWAGQWFTGLNLGYVNVMKFGDRGHDTTDPTLPKETSLSREQLFCEDESRPIIISKAAAIDFPDGEQGQKVRFTCSIGANEGNGTGRQAYSEAGMYRADTLLAAHKTFGLITKTNEFILTFRWTFQF
jgi:hypothetical protein